MRVPGFLSFFLIVLARSNFDHYTRECGFGILKKKNKTLTSSPSNSLAAPFGSTVMSHMGENRQALLEGGSESPSRVKADWNCLLHILAFSFLSVLRLPFSLSDAIPNATF